MFSIILRNIGIKFLNILGIRQDETFRNYYLCKHR